MNRLLILLPILICLNNTRGQVPQAIPYQAAAMYANGQSLINKSIMVKFSILDSSATGTNLYTETQNTTTNSLGIFNLNIGSGIAISGNFGALNWGSNAKFLKVELDTSAIGNNYSVIGTQQIMSVPYALYAKSAGNISGVTFFTHHIGEEFGGGIIFHLWKDSSGVEHGLIVNKTDLSASQPWSNVGILIGTTAQSPWDGLSNSNAIVGQAGHTSSAAALCLNSNNGGQSDWYLPSIDELSLLWHSRFNVNKTLSTIGGAASLPISAYYWSSTEYDSNDTWFFFFDLGDADNYLKTNPSYVRAVRAF
jgi:hypothetical protein